MTKPIQKNINGILLVNKGLGMSSNGLLQRVKRLFGAKKAGHTGSLDPLASGMLPICFGEATKISQYLLDSDKYYYVTAQLGQRTTTGDAEGEVIETLPVDVTETEVKAALQQFLGVIDQVPPMYSAIKVQGQPLYKLARQGIEIERQSRQVTIHSLEFESFIDTSVTFAVHCTKGTYVRTLVEDVGKVLGCGAYVSQLHRTAVAPYEQATMYSMETLEAACEADGQDALRSFLLPLESSVQGIPAIKLSTATAFYLRTGQTVTVPAQSGQGLVRLFSEQDQFMGIGELTEDGRVAPRRLFNY